MEHCVRRKSTNSTPCCSQNTVHITLPADLVVFALTGTPSSFFLHSLDDTLLLGVSVVKIKELSPSASYHVSKPRKSFIHVNFCSKFNSLGNPSRRYFAILKVFMDDRLYTTNTEADVVWCDAGSRSTIMRLILYGFAIILESFGPFKQSSPTQALTTELISQTQKNFHVGT